MLLLLFVGHIFSFPREREKKSIVEESETGTEESEWQRRNGRQKKKHALIPSSENDFYLKGRICSQGEFQES